MITLNILKKGKQVQEFELENNSIDSCITLNVSSMEVELTENIPNKDILFNSKTALEYMYTSPRIQLYVLRGIIGNNEISTDELKQIMIEFIKEGMLIKEYATYKKTPIFIRKLRRLLEEDEIEEEVL